MVARGAKAPDGNYQKIGDPTEVNVTEDLFWEKESQGYAFATLEHFVPMLPNIKVMHTKLEQDGAGSLTTPFVFDGKTFSVGVINDASLEALDLYAYYEVLDNVVSLDLGLNIRNVTIDYNIMSSTGESAKDSFSATLPMLYAMVGATPWPDLTISGEISYIAYDGSSISDITAKISYTTEFFVGLELGYRKQAYEFDDIDDNNADLSFDGVFAGAHLKF